MYTQRLSQSVNCLSLSSIAGMEDSAKMCQHDCKTLSCPTRAGSGCEWRCPLCWPCVHPPFVLFYTGYDDFYYCRGRESVWHDIPLPKYSYFFFTKAVGTACIGSSEAIMLATLAMKWRWKERQRREGQSTSNPNMVFGSNVQVCWWVHCIQWFVPISLLGCCLNCYY